MGAGSVLTGSRLLYFVHWGFLSNDVNDTVLFDLVTCVMKADVHDASVGQHHSF